MANVRKVQELKRHQTALIVDESKFKNLETTPRYKLKIHANSSEEDTKITGNSDKIFPESEPEDIGTIYLLFEAKAPK